MNARKVQYLIAISAVVYLTLWAVGQLPWGLVLTFELILFIVWDWNCPNRACGSISRACKQKEPNE